MPLVLSSVPGSSMSPTVRPTPAPKPPAPLKLVALSRPKAEPDVVDLVFGGLLQDLADVPH